MTVSDEDNGQRHFGKRMWQLRVWGCGSCEYATGGQPGPEFYIPESLMTLILV